MRFDLGTLDSGERSLPFGLLVSFFFLSLQFSNIKSFLSLFDSGTARPTKLKVGTHVDTG